MNSNQFEEVVEWSKGHRNEVKAQVKKIYKSGVFCQNLDLLLVKFLESKEEQFYDLFLELFNSIEFLSHWQYQIENLEDKEEKKARRLNLRQRWTENAIKLLEVKHTLSKNEVIDILDEDLEKPMKETKLFEMLEGEDSYLDYWVWTDEKIEILVPSTIYNLMIQLRGISNVEGVSVDKQLLGKSMETIKDFNKNKEKFNYLRSIKENLIETEKDLFKKQGILREAKSQVDLEKEIQILENKINSASSDRDFIKAQELQDQQEAVRSEIKKNRRIYDNYNKTIIKIYDQSYEDFINSIEAEKELKKERKKKISEEKESKKPIPPKKKTKKEVFHDKEIEDLLLNNNLAQAFWLSSFSNIDKRVFSEDYLYLVAYGSSAYPRRNQDVNNKELFKTGAADFSEAPQDGSAESWIAIAACLKPFLFYQGMNVLYNFVHLKSNIESVDKILDLSVKFFKESHNISTTSFITEEEMRDLKEEAGNLLVKARKGHYGSKTAAGLFQRAQFRTGTGDTLGAYLESIVKGEFADLDFLHEFAKVDPEDFIKQNSVPGKRLEGTLRRQIKSLVEESLQLIKFWSEDSLRQNGDQRINSEESLATLKQMYKNASNKIENQIQEASGKDPLKIAAGKVLSSVIKDLDLIFQGNDSKIISPQESLLFKEINLDNNFQPFNLKIEDRLKICEENLSPLEAYEFSMKNGEIQRAKRIIGLVPDLKTKVDYELDLKEFSALFSDLLIQSRQNVETLYQLGESRMINEDIAPEAWRSKELNNIISLDTNLNESHESELLESFRQLLRTSNELKEVLGTLKIKAEEDVNLVWKSIEEDIDKSTFLKQTKIILDSNDLQALGDYISSVKSALIDGGTLPITNEFFQGDLESFQSWEESFDTNTVLESENIDAILQKKELSITPEERKLVHYLFNHKENPEDILEKITDTLNLNLGRVVSNNFVKNIPANELIFNLNVLPQSPVPEFGSAVQDRKFKLLNVLGFFDGSNTSLNKNIINQGSYGTYPTFIFVPQFLSAESRINFSKSNLNTPSKALLIDLSVVIFSARAKDKLKTFFNITLPFSSINPFITEDAVPEELFFGRKEQLASLMDPKGGNIVYGGRQLGKSSLLKNLRDKSPHDTKVIWKQLKDLPTNSANHKELLFRFWYECVYETLLENKVLQKEKISKNPNTFRPSEVVNLIKNRLRKPGRIIICLDESDNFLEWDSDNDFSVVSTLAGLMNETDFRFKVVFAGLRSVQRFSHISNQPFAHLGKEIVVGALEVQPAQKLVIGMLATLGYSFQEDYLFNHMMSLVNYQASLMQVYCAEIVKNLNGRRGEKYRTIISRADLDNIEENKDFIQEIKKRFNLTIALDPKYKCLSYAYILEKDEQDSHSTIYFKALGKDWAPSLFNNLSTSQIETILNEMTGLGLLSRSGEDNYQLKSPNMKRLFGNKEILMEELQDIERIGVLTTNHGNERRPLKEGHSVFTLDQENTLFDRRKNFGISFVLANQINGFDQIEGHIDAIGEVEKWEKVHLSFKRKSKGMMFKNISEKLQKQNRKNIYGVIEIIDKVNQQSFINDLKDLKNTGIKSSREDSRGRIFVLIDPVSYWRNYNEFKEAFDEFSLTSIEPLSDGSIAKILTHMEMSNIADDDSAKEIVALTGGNLSVLDNILTTIKDKSVTNSYKGRIDHVRSQSVQYCYLRPLEKLGLNNVDKKMLKILIDWIILCAPDGEIDKVGYKGIELDLDYLKLICDEQNFMLTDMDMLINFLIDLRILKEEITNQDVVKWAMLPGTAKLILGEEYLLN
jgi:hypothetical protein